MDEVETVHAERPAPAAAPTAPAADPATAPVPTPPAPGPPRIRRRRQGAVVAGVAGGVADHLGVDVLRVRLVFVLLVAASGAGFLAYAALWLFCPIEPRGVLREVPPGERRQGLGLATLGVGLAFVLSAMGGQ
ncbi:MAG TPA: PspC domain-containing protein, partial [Actinomycetospora sp.]|nr:PspC domain-containing protein [Actinomycetospora sp.]